MLGSDNINAIVYGTMLRFINKAQSQGRGVIRPWDNHTSADIHHDLKYDIAFIQMFYKRILLVNKNKQGLLI